MGNWKRKPRRNYNYESPRSHKTEPPLRPPSGPGSWEGNVPPWEKRFCASAGVPWGKVLYSKRYIHYNIDVLNWDDSAAEEAFHNAKRRFWEEINGIPCPIPLPDPDIYIDDIDWNPYIDPEVIHKLDKEFFAPDEIKDYCKLEDSSRKTNSPLPGCTGEGYDSNPASSDNPWELNMQKTLKDTAWTWDKWGGCKNELSNFDKTNSLVLAGSVAEGHYRKPDCGDCPWEYGNMQGVMKGEARAWNQWGGNINESRNLNGNNDCLKHICTWASGVVRDDSGGHCEGNSWRIWNKGSKHINQFSNLDSGVDDWNRSWNQAKEARKVKAREGWSQGWNYQNKSGNLDTVDNPWKRGCHGPESMGFKGGDLGNNTWGGNQTEKNESDSRAKSQCWNQWENGNNEPKQLESRKGSGGWGVWNGGCRKRVGSHENTSSYKCSRVQGDGYQTGHWGRKGRAKKRFNLFSAVDNNE